MAREGLMLGEAVDNDLLGKIETAIPSMSRSDVKIAKLLLASPHAFIRSSVREIASEIGISEPTVVRFCRNVGCEGFKDLKFRITQELAVLQAQRDSTLPQPEHKPTAADRPSERRVVTPAMPDDHYAARLHARAVEAIDSAFAEIDTRQLDLAAGMLARARRVAIYGLGGSSAIMAEEMHNRLYRLGIASVFVGESYTQRMLAATLTSEDVAMFVSSTGRPRALQDSLDIAQYYGAQSIAITDNESRLGRDVDVCLKVGLSQSGVNEFQPNPMRYSQLFVIDLLAFRVAETLGDKARQVLRQTRASVASLHGIAPQQPIGD